MASQAMSCTGKITWCTFGCETAEKSNQAFAKREKNVPLGRFFWTQHMPAPIQRQLNTLPRSPLAGASNETPGLAHKSR